MDPNETPRMSMNTDYNFDDQYYKKTIDFTHPQQSTHFSKGPQENREELKQLVEKSKNNHDVSFSDINNGVGELSTPRQYYSQQQKLT